MSASVSFSVSVGQPGFYGRIDIGDYPQPRVLYRQPIVVERAVVKPSADLLARTAGHAKNWRQHCREYNACGERVYFVQDSWYDREYVPRYRERHGEYRDDRRRNDQYDRRHDNRGRGHNR